MALFDSQNEQQAWRTILVLVVIISAVVGSVFGYYGPSLFQGDLQRSADNGNRLSEEEESDRVVALVKEVSPAVVSIVATKDVPVFESSPFSELCRDPFFRQFFSGCSAEPQQNGTQTQQVAAGTGFFIQSDGLIVTNKHVISATGVDLTIITNDGKKYSAKVLAQDPLHDIAVIKVTGNNFPTVPLGDSDQILVGQTVIAIGNALGEFTNSVSKGIISGLARSITAQSGNSSERLEQVIQTDAAINPGNSGGPLLNLDGEVIGINTAIVSGAENLGFAIPINQAKRDIDNVKTFGRIIYPYLGVRYVLVDPDVQQEANLPFDYGALIARSSSGEPAVIAGSPAAKADIQENDLILEIDGKRLTLDHTLAQAVQAHKVGDTMRLKIWRNGDQRTIDIVLTERP